MVLRCAEARLAPRTRWNILSHYDVYPNVDPAGRTIVPTLGHGYAPDRLVDCVVLLEGWKSSQDERGMVFSQAMSLGNGEKVVAA